MGLIFWVLMLICIVFGVVVPNAFDWGKDNRRVSTGNSIVLLILLGLLGWKVFGAAIQG